MVLVGTQGKCSLDLQVYFCDRIDCSKLAKPCPVLSPLLHQRCHSSHDESLWINQRLISRVVVCHPGFPVWLAIGPWCCEDWFEMKDKRPCSILGTRSVGLQQWQFRRIFKKYIFLVLASHGGFLDQQGDADVEFGQGNQLCNKVLKWGRSPLAWQSRSLAFLGDRGFKTFNRFPLSSVKKHNWTVLLGNLSAIPFLKLYGNVAFSLLKQPPPILFFLKPSLEQQPAAAVLWGNVGREGYQQYYSFFCIWAVFWIFPALFCQCLTLMFQQFPILQLVCCME